jgi:hypothetical protein
VTTSASPLQRAVPRWAGCLVVLISLALCAVAFEVVAQRGVLRREVAVVRDPDHRLPADDARAGTNSDGLRSRVEAEDLPSDGCTVLVLGDSFTYGVQLDYEQTLPQRLEALLRRRSPGVPIHAVNAGWESSSPLLGLRLLREIGRKYHPDLVLYALDMTDFRDDLQYGNLLERPGVYRLAGVAPATLLTASRLSRRTPLFEPVFRMPSDRFFIVNQPLTSSRPWMESTWSNLEALHRESDALGARFAVLVLPRNFQYSAQESPFSWEAGAYEALGPWVHEPFRYLEERSVNAGFPVVSLLPAFQRTEVFPTCFVGDPHWTPGGADVAAEAVFEAVVAGEWLAGCQ